jgi:hypothetical protein
LGSHVVLDGVMHAEPRTPRASTAVARQGRIVPPVFALGEPANGEGVARLEPCEEWKPYVAAPIPKPVKVAPDDDDGGCDRSGRRDSNPLSAPFAHFASATAGWNLLRRAAQT